MILKLLVALIKDKLFLDGNFLIASLTFSWKKQNKQAVGDSPYNYPDLEIIKANTFY